MRKCQRCNRENLEAANYCDSCGQRMRKKQKEASINMLASPAYLEVGLLDRKYEIFPDRDALVGRGDANKNLFLDIMLPEKDAVMHGVSRVHAKIFCHDNIYYIADLDSTNSVYLNGKKLFPQAPHPLHNDDTIQLGLLSAKFMLERT